MNEKSDGEFSQRYFKFFAFFVGCILVLSLFNLSLMRANEGDINSYHFIVGEATYFSSGAAEGAHVTVENQRTGEDLLDVVGVSGNSGTSGYYMVDIGDYSLGYQHGDAVTVTVTGVGAYSDWQGISSTTVDNNSVSQIVDVILYSSETPLLSYAPELFDFGSMLEGQVDSTSFDVWNAGDGTLTYSLSESCGWVVVSPMGGSSTGEVDVIDVTIDTSGLSVGSYSCGVVISSNGGSDNFLVTVTVLESDYPPEISNILVAPTVAEAGSLLRISARITDDIAINQIYLNITYPKGAFNNLSLTQHTGSTYYYEQYYTLLGHYNFTVYATDSSAQGTTSAQYTFQVTDTIPPAISDVAVDPTQIEPDTPVNITAVITDFVEVAEVYIAVEYPDASVENNTATGSIPQTNTYYYVATYDLLGVYNFTIYATDTSGNGYTSQHFSFIVQDIVPPLITVLSPNGSENLSGEVTIEWNVTDDYDTSDDLTVTIKYSSDSGASWQSINSDIGNTGEYEWDTTDLTDGTNYLIKVQIEDITGNEGTDISDAVFTVDNTEPSLVVQKPAPGKLYLLDKELMPILGTRSIIIGKITIVTEATDDTSGIDNVKFYIDNDLKHTDATEPYQWEWDETIFFTHTVKVVAYDNAGNRNEQIIDVFIYNI